MQGLVLLGGFVGLIREAGAAGGAACFPGGGEGHLVQVAIAHEPDEDAVSVVVPGHARDHGYLHGGVRARGLLILLGLRGRGGTGGGDAGDKRELGLGRGFGFGNRFGVADRLALGSGFRLGFGLGSGFVLRLSRRLLAGWRGFGGAGRGGPLGRLG
jgi:hypothetical protein